MSDLLPYDKVPPQYTDKYGNKFWYDKGSSQYATSKKLVGVQVLFVERPDGKRMRVIVENGEVIYEATSIENIGAKLDIMSLSKRT